VAEDLNYHEDSYQVDDYSHENSLSETPLYSDRDERNSYKKLTDLLGYFLEFITKILDLCDEIWYVATIQCSAIVECGQDSVDSLLPPRFRGGTRR
jgi:hypothetical protein